MITILKDLYAQFDSLYRDILFTCKGCSDHDCEGYIWLMQEESRTLASNGVSIVELNKSCNLINPFKKNDLEPKDFEQMKPKCPLRENGLCSIYKLRPLVCRMYPFGLTTIAGKTVFVLFKDCKFIREMDNIEKAEFANRAIGIIYDCSKSLYNKIVKAYSDMDALSKYPDGANEYDILT